MFEVPFKVQMKEMEISLQSEAHLVSFNKPRWRSEPIITFCVHLFVGCFFFFFWYVVLK